MLVLPLTQRMKSEIIIKKKTKGMIIKYLLTSSKSIIPSGEQQNVVCANK